MLKFKLYYDRRSVGESVLVSGTHLGPAAIFPLSLIILKTATDLVTWGILSDAKSGL
jgi:hypothetical protein